MEKRILNKFKKMSRKDKDAHGLTLVKVFDHLDQNLKDADMDDSYRRREAYRTQIALDQIHEWLSVAKKKLSLDKEKKQ